MDIDDSGSIQAVVEKLKTEKAEMYRIVANAAVGFDVGLKMPFPEMAETFIRTNFLSTIDFIKQSLPLLANDGRIVIVSAIFATLQKQPETVRKVLTNPNVTEKELI
jgi:NAD(P)-dependent dehydrogenase (short-subunit alcohol dehydrogenase family)